MPIKLEDLEDFQRGRDKYTGAIAAAKAAADETAELRAELEWRDVQLALRQQVDERNDRERAIQGALEQAKKDFPDVPERLYAKLSDPEDIVEAAKEAQAAIDERVKATATPPRSRQTQAAPQSQSNGNGWPQPPSGSSAPPSGKRDKYDDEDYLQDLNKRFNRKDSRDRVEAAGEVVEQIFNRQVLPNFQRAIDRGTRSEQ